MKTVIKGFEQYIYTPPLVDEGFEDQTLYKFDNGFGASIIYHQGSYGYEQGLVELGVIRWFGSKYMLTYDTHLTDDVLGDLTQEQAKSILEKIKEL